MLFVDPTFLFVFLPISLAAFYGFARVFGPIAAYAVLCIASLVFYVWEGALATTLLLASLAINLVTGIYLTRPSPPEHEARRTKIFILGMVYNFAMLGLFKYANQVVALFGLWGGEKIVAAEIPPGISFYTFHQAVFLADCWSRRPEMQSVLRPNPDRPPPARGILTYASFVLLFPQLIIGPISYLREMAPQFASPHFSRARRLDIEIGLMMLAVGLFKKLVIADYMVRFVEPAFGVLSSGGLVPRHVAIGAVLAYYAQLYFDFSGYSDAALGLARLFGLRLPLNFDSPLRATGIVDFYRRWHMTLTRVISRFLYTPLAMAGARWALDHRYGPFMSKVVSLWLPLMINFQIIALWHGATATFVLFGLIHGIWYVTETEIRATKKWRDWRKRTSETRRRIYGQIFTFVPLALTFALFRSDSPATFYRLVISLLFGSGGANENLGYRGFYIEIIGAFAVIWFLPNLNELMRRYRPSIATFVNPSTTPLWARFVWRPTAIWGLFGAAIVAVVISRLNKPTPFLYGGF